MKQVIKQFVLTPYDIINGSIGVSAVINGVWMDYLDPVAQILVRVGGLVLLWYTIRHMRIQWKLKKRELDRLDRE